MSECKTLKDYKEYKAIMDDIDDDMIMDDDLLKDYLSTNLDRYRIKKEEEIYNEEKNDDTIDTGKQLDDNKNTAEQVAEPNIL